MEIDSIKREELQEIIFQLEQALYNHQQWHYSIIRSLICRLPADRHDISKDAHKECRFGQWYYETSPKKLRQHPGFTALGEEHRKMHQEAAELLTTISHGSTIRPYDYDNFANTLQRMQLEISALHRELNDLLYTQDTLTGAINRVNMLPMLREQQALVKRKLQSCSLVMLDLDHFKTVNDRYGHTVGDYVLGWVSRFIIERLRPYDKIFRVGGEEFLISLPNSDTKNAFDIVERLRTGIDKARIKIDKHKPIHFTVSFGITSIEPNVTVERAIERADQALYQAKTEGRNCTRIWSEVLR